jgi:citronellol/citronellal dehydrogenase
MKAKWFKNHVAYTMAKFGMSMCTLGMSAEFAKDGIAVNSLWPLTAIDTAAVRNLLGGATVASMSRCPRSWRTRRMRSSTGRARVHRQFLHRRGLVLRAEGVTDFSVYAPGARGPLAGDFFVPDEVFDCEGLSFLRQRLPGHRSS